MCWASSCWIHPKHPPLLWRYHPSGTGVTLTTIFAKIAWWIHPPALDHIECFYWDDCQIHIHMLVTLKLTKIIGSTNTSIPNWAPPKTVLFRVQDVLVLHVHLWLGELLLFRFWISFRASWAYTSKNCNIGGMLPFPLLVASCNIVLDSSMVWKRQSSVSYRCHCCTGNETLNASMTFCNSWASLVPYINDTTFRVRVI